MRHSLLIYYYPVDPFPLILPPLSLSVVLPPHRPDLPSHSSDLQSPVTSSSLHCIFGLPAISSALSPTVLRNRYPRFNRHHNLDRWTSVNVGAPAADVASPATLVKFSCTGARDLTCVLIEKTELKGSHQVPLTRSRSLSCVVLPITRSLFLYV